MLNVKFKILIIFGFLAGVWLISFFFIPAFRGEIEIKSGINFGGILIHYYGLVMALAILVCYFVARRIGSRFGITVSQIESALPWLVIFGLAGARLYFVAFSWDFFGLHLGEIVQIWRGGLSIYGAVIGGAAGLWLYCKKNHLSLGSFFDLATLVLPLGQAIGRFGNFFNQEAFGRPTDLPWGLYIEPVRRPIEFLTEKYFHPTFLYESIWNFLVFIVLWRIAATKPNSGLLFGLYLIMYSMGRFFIEGLRLDSFFLDGVRIDQITALAMMIIGLILMIRVRKASNEV